MYKTICECDRCGKEMQSPMYTLELRTNSFCIQDQVDWHYCNDCWEYVKKDLTKKNNELNDLEKIKKELKKENDVIWLREFWEAILKSAIQEKKNVMYSSPYMLYIINTNGKKSIQVKSAGDELFIAEYCCENINKDSLNYK